MGQSPEKGHIQELARHNSLFQSILRNSEVLADAYAEYALFNGDELKEAIAKTFERVVGELREHSKRDFFALMGAYELEMLTRIDKALAEQDASVLPEVVGWVDSSLNYQVEAKISGWDIDVDVAGAKSKFIPQKATWAFNRHGIRLVVEYIDTSTGERREAHTGMDFHMRSEDYNKEHGLELDKAQGALDITGEYLTPALHNIDMDYHVADEMDKVLDWHMLREIKEGRARAIQRWLDTEQS